jgi:hypothetical protein
MQRPPSLIVMLFGLCCMLRMAPGTAHHSYAMFDMTRGVAVEGSVAKVEWVNPHVFLWMYVRKPGGGHELFAFENGPINQMVRYGWRKDVLKGGDKLAVLYFPLRDGRKGGYFVRGVRSDGLELGGDPHAPGVQRELQRKTPLKAPQP